MLRILEILFYELIDLIPNLLLTLFLFEKQLRFSKIPSALFVLLLYFITVFSRIAALNGLSYAAILSVMWILLYLLFYFICIREKITKLLFVLLTIMNYCSFVVIIFSHITFHRFSWISTLPYSILSSIVLFGTYLVSYPAIFLLLHKKARPLLDTPAIDKQWRYMWLVPATFCLSYYYNLYTSGGIIAYSSRLSHVLFAVLFNAGALFVTYLLLKFMGESHAAYALKEENEHLNMQFLQYENLKTRIEEARRAKHDLRQNMTVIQSYIRDNDMDGLSQFIGQYIETLPSDSPIAYCNDYAMNALIGYYASIAGEHAVAFRAEIEYPDSLCIPHSDAIVLFGNLLENAIDACRRCNIPEPFISFRIRPMHDVLVITLDNSFSGHIHKLGNAFMSSKSKRAGIGTSSIQKIADKYHGIVTFDYDEHEFHASVLLNHVSVPATTQ